MNCRVLLQCIHVITSSCIFSKHLIEISTKNDGVKKYFLIAVDYIVTSKFCFEKHPRPSPQGAENLRGNVKFPLFSALFFFFFCMCEFFLKIQANLSGLAFAPCVSFGFSCFGMCRSKCPNHAVRPAELEKKVW